MFVLDLLPMVVWLFLGSSHLAINVEQASSARGELRRTPSRRSSQNAPFTRPGRKRVCWFTCTKHDGLGGAVPRRAIGLWRRAVGVGESVASPEGAFAEWRGYAVTYPTKYKLYRAKLSRPALRGMRGTIRSNEGLAAGYNLPRSHLSQCSVYRDLTIGRERP